MNSERGALVRGSNPPQGHRVYTHDRWHVAGAASRRMTKKQQLGAGVHETNDKKFSIRLEWPKIEFFLRFGRLP